MPRIFALIAFIAWGLLLWPYQVATFMAACVACVSLPFYKKLQNRFSASMSFSLYTILLVLMTTLPASTVIWLVTPQAVAGMRTLDRLRDATFLESPAFQEWFATTDKWLSGIPGLEGGINQLASYAAEMAGTAVSIVLSGGVGIAGGAFQILVNMFLFILITIVCVMHADIIFEFAARLTNFPKEMLTRFIVALRNAIFGILMGVVLVAMIQGLLCGIGFAVAGVPQPAFWGLVATFVAPIPFIGTMLIWGPVCIWLGFTQATLTPAIGLFLWAAFVVAGVDNFMRPYFLKTGINASIAALILAILCGLAAFGPIGIVAGPVLVALAIQAAYESTMSSLTKNGNTPADMPTEATFIDENLLSLAEQRPANETSETPEGIVPSDVR